MPNVFKKLPKNDFSRKLKIFSPLQKLPKNVEYLGKLIGAKICPKSNKSHKNVSGKHLIRFFQKWAILGVFLLILVFQKLQLTLKIGMPVSEFEPRISDVRSDRSTKSDITCSNRLLLYRMDVMQLDYYKLGYLKVLRDELNSVTRFDEISTLWQKKSLGNFFG